MSFANGLGKKEEEEEGGDGGDDCSYDGGDGGEDDDDDNGDKSVMIMHISVTSLHVPSMAVATLLTGVSSMSAPAHLHLQHLTSRQHTFTFSILLHTNTPTLP